MAPDPTPTYPMLLTRSDLDLLEIGGGELESWLRSDKIVCIGQLPGLAPDGQGELVLAVTADDLRAQLGSRLETVGWISNPRTDEELEAVLLSPGHGEAMAPAPLQDSETTGETTPSFWSSEADEDAPWPEIEVFEADALLAATQDWANRWPGRNAAEVLAEAARERAPPWSPRVTVADLVPRGEEPESQPISPPAVPAPELAPGPALRAEPPKDPLEVLAPMREPHGLDRSLAAMHAEVAAFDARLRMARARHGMAAKERPSAPLLPILAAAIAAWAIVFWFRSGDSRLGMLAGFAFSIVLLAAPAGHARAARGFSGGA